MYHVKIHLIANKICTVCKLTTFYYCIVDVLPVYKKREDQKQIPGEHLLEKELKGLCYWEEKKTTTTFIRVRREPEVNCVSDARCLSILLQTVSHAKPFMVDGSN